MVTPLPPDFREFLRLLNSEGVRYLVVGGYAVAHHGYPRPTGDLDVWVAVDPENAALLFTVLSKFGFGGSIQSERDFLVPDKVFRMGYPPVRIEVLTGISGVRFDECYAQRVTIDIDGIAVDVIAKSDLIQNKRSSGRHKDMDDVEQLGG
jgi:predicted nucleotidyltransferase